MSPPQVCKIVTFPRVPQRISGNKDRSGFQQENSFLSAGFFINVQIASNAHSFPQHGTWREAERRKKGYVAQREKKIRNAETFYFSFLPKSKKSNVTLQKELRMK